MICSFADQGTEDIYDGNDTKTARWRCPPLLWTVAIRELDQLNRAEHLQDVLAPPGNRLKSLAGDREGQYSIRINDQYMICFHWSDKGPENVEIVDCH